MEIDKGVKELIRRLADEDNMVTVIADPLIEEAVTLSGGHGLKVSVVNGIKCYNNILASPLNDIEIAATATINPYVFLYHSPPYIHISIIKNQD